MLVLVQNLFMEELILYLNLLCFTLAWPDQEISNWSLSPTTKWGLDLFFECGDGGHSFSNRHVNASGPKGLQDV